jgi:hypothetical protein
LQLKDSNSDSLELFLPMDAQNRSLQKVWQLIYEGCP